MDFPTWRMMSINPKQKSMKSSSFHVLLLVAVFVQQIENSYGVVISSDNEHTQACSFYETKNVTNGYEQPDGSWYHDGISYPIGHFMTYNFIRRNGTVIKVAPHVRACYCLQRPCITACCETDNVINWKNGHGDGSCHEADEKYDQVLWEVGILEPQTKDLLKAFHWKYFKPDCQLFFLNKEWDSDRWTLLEVQKCVNQCSVAV